MKTFIRGQEGSCMEKSFYHADPLFLRNGYEMAGRWNFLFVRKQELSLDNGVELIAVSDTSKTDVKNLHKGVHFFVFDPKFEDIYTHPERTLYKAIHMNKFFTGV
jgi:hypothetical protein